MAKIESYAPGSFCWAELATTDTAAAKQFYPVLSMAVVGGGPNTRE